MRHFLGWMAAIGLMAVSSGCVPPERINAAPEYPELGRREALPEGDTAGGKLLIVTPTDLDQNIGYADAGPCYVHSGYTVYDENGVKVKHVQNHSSPGPQGPFEVGLAPGKYLILLDEADHGARVFRVTVKAGSLTRVDEPQLKSLETSAH